MAAALDLRLRIWPTPVALMRLPVLLMEKFAARPLSTRAQLHMLVEGLTGDPEPARRELGVEPAPFAPERLRRIVERSTWSLPVDLRLFVRPAPELPAGSAVLAMLVAVATLTGIFRFAPDPWIGMTVGMAALGAVALAFRAVRSRLRLTPVRILAGLASGAALYGLTRLALLGLSAAWPDWPAHARALLSWKGGHGPAFLLPTLVLIVVAEEVVWRGLATRFFAERWGRAAGILAGAALYAAAHAATLNPLLLVAAVVLGVVWGWLFLATDDLVLPSACHLGWDLLLLFGPPIA